MTTLLLRLLWPSARPLTYKLSFFRSLKNSADSYLRATPNYKKENSKEKKRAETYSKNKTQTTQQSGSKKWHGCVFLWVQWWQLACAHWWREMVLVVERGWRFGGVWPIRFPQWHQSCWLAGFNIWFYFLSSASYTRSRLGNSTTATYHLLRALCWINLLSSFLLKEGGGHVPFRWGADFKPRTRAKLS